MSVYTVGLVGLGSIAGMSYGEPADAATYNHAGGLRDCKGARLAAVADNNPRALAAFRQKWGATFPDLRYYNSIDEMMQGGVPDVVSVCVRGPDHYDVTMRVLEASPRLVFLEKPPTCSLAEMDALLAAAGKKKIPITVSYSRHWVPQVLRTEELVRDGLIGQVKQVIGFVGGPFLSFASHTTDLICQFAGYGPQAVYARGTAGSEAPAGYEPEPILQSMTIEFANGVIGVQCGCDTEHGGFYCDVIGTEGMVRTGIGQPLFGCNRKREPIDFSKLNMPPYVTVFTVAYEQIARHLSGGPLPACTNEDFAAVHEIGFAAIESVLTNRRIELPNVHRTRKIFANG
jgi:predicted dehydrogenase